MLHFVFRWMDKCNTDLTHFFPNFAGRQNLAVFTMRMVFYADQILFGSQATDIVKIA